MQNIYDLVVVGAGPGGTRAAFTAAALGLKTAVVEAGFLGGTCLNSGCIPTKFLLGGSAFLPLQRAQAKFGVAVGQAGVDLPALQARKDRFIKGTRSALEKQFAGAGITLIRGRAAFSGRRELTVKGGEGGPTLLSFTKCILAGGSTPASFPGLKPDGDAVLASSSLLNLKEVPESLIIVGGGAIGLELGEFFHRLGCAITLVEGMPRILPGEDEETGDFMEKYLIREGWKVHTGRRIADLRSHGGRAVLTFEDAETLSAARALVAVGRRPGTAGLAPEMAEIFLNARGWVETDDHLRASAHVYAVGDINGRIQLAHAADDQGAYAARHAAGAEAGPYAPPVIPACIYGTMEVMRVGPTVRELAKAGKNISVSRSAAAANPIIQASGHTQGFIQAAWADDILQSITAVCHNASHLVGPATLLVGKKVRREIGPEIIFAHPTLDECIRDVLEAPQQPV